VSNRERQAPAWQVASIINIAELGLGVPGYVSISGWPINQVIFNPSHLVPMYTWKNTGL